MPERQYSPEHPANLARIAELDPAARSNATARLVILAQLRRAVPAVMEEVKAMGNITFDIKNHPVLNDIFEKGKLEGEARGETRGRAETLLRQLRKRTVPFQKLSSTVSMRLEVATSTNGPMPSLMLPAWKRFSNPPSTEPLRRG